MVGFHQKIHFLLGNLPHLIKDRRDVEGASFRADNLHQSRRTLQKDNVLLHHVVNVGTLNFYDHVLARRQNGAMYLGDRRRAQNFFGDRGKKLLPRPFIFPFQDGNHSLEGHRPDVRLQSRQGVAIFLRQKIGTHAHDLAQLHKSRPQILQNLPNLLRRNAPHQLPFSENVYHLAEPPRRKRPLLLFIRLFHQAIQHTNASVQPFNGSCNIC